MSSRGIAISLAALLLGAAAVHAATPAQNCRSAKNKTAGKYAYCRQKAEAKFATAVDAIARTDALPEVPR